MYRFRSVRPFLCPHYWRYSFEMSLIVCLECLLSKMEKYRYITADPPCFGISALVSNQIGCNLIFWVLSGLFNSPQKLNVRLLFDTVPISNQISCFWYFRPSEKMLTTRQKKCRPHFFGVVSNTAPKSNRKSEKNIQDRSPLFLFGTHNVTPDFEGFGFLILMISASIFHLK